MIMENIKIEILLQKLNISDLNSDEIKLIEAAKETTSLSYAPYSKFNVGAAIMIEDGTIIKGSNQENAAYPSGMCAERTALFYTNSQYPNTKVLAIAIAARDCNGFTKIPITPCGSCRQVLLETENRFDYPITFYLYGMEYLYKIEGTRNLLPLSFCDEYLK